VFLALEARQAAMHRSAADLNEIGLDAGLANGFENFSE
jgi:hypothetical protein